MKRPILALYGVGGLGAEILELARQIDLAESRFDGYCFIDDDPDASPIDGLPLFNFDEFQREYSFQEADVAICVGEPRLRGLLANKVKSAGYSLATLVHPDVQVPSNAELGEGVVVYHYCNIGPNAKIGDNTALLLGANAPHDNLIGKNCVLSTYAILSGSCTVGDYAYIAAGATVQQGVSIGEWAIVGLASAVFRDVESEVITIGNPAKKVGKNDTHSVFNR